MRKERGPLSSPSPRRGEREKRLVRARARMRVDQRPVSRNIVSTSCVQETQPGLALTNSLTEQRFSFLTHEISDFS